MVCVVINADYLKQPEVLIDKLCQIEGIKSICININEKNTNVILGDKCETIWGEDTITDYIGDVKFKIGPLSFFQVNPVQTKKLYGKALEYAELSGDEIVWDLYCGIGTISLFLAKAAKKVYGIEIVPEAIENAKENAEINGIENASFYAGAAEDLAPLLLNGKLDKNGDCCGANELYKSGSGTAALNDNVSEYVPEVIVVDPPRKGCDEKLLETILSVMPSKVVYVSCDPATLARDLKILCADGKYELKKVCPVDQFCHTTHTETVVLLTHQRKPDDYLKIHVDLDELDLTKSESKATYEEIRNYVKDKHNMRVTNLYIAQVKRDMGIIERINYNVGDGKAKVPQCPKDKYEAIVDALKHFQMIA